LKQTNTTLQPGCTVAIKEDYRSVRHPQFAPGVPLYLRNIKRGIARVSNTNMSIDIRVEHLEPINREQQQISPGTIAKVALNHSGHMFRLDTKIRVLREVHYTNGTHKAWECINKHGVKSLVEARDLKVIAD
jgi:hypothetical protein